MEEDSWSGVCTFSCKCKLAILCTHKIYISPQQITDDIVGTSDHQIDRSFIIFIMPCTHGVFKIVLIIIFTTQHADTALCQKRIWQIRPLLCKHQNFFSFWKIQGTVKTCRSGTYNNGIIIFIHFLIPLSCHGFVLPWATLYYWSLHVSRHLYIFYCLPVLTPITFFMASKKNLCSFVKRTAFTLFSRFTFSCFSSIITIEQPAMGVTKFSEGAKSWIKTN